MTLTRKARTGGGVLGAALVLMATLMSGSVGAATSWGGSGSALSCPATGNENQRCVLTGVQGRIGTAIHPNDSTAGWAALEPENWRDTLVRRLQIDKIVLGTQYGV